MPPLASYCLLPQQMGNQIEVHQHGLSKLAGSGFLVSATVESFGFLGFEFRRIRSRRGRWMPLRTPKGKKRTALLRKLKEVFRRYSSRPVRGLIAEINPILRGWVNCFAFGHSSRCFSYVRFWVEKKLRRHLAHACQRRGYGWKRWSSEWLCGRLGLFHEYRVSCGQPLVKVASSR
jgi:RNA-directed DNA polymerase